MIFFFVYVSIPRERGPHLNYGNFNLYAWRLNSDWTNVHALNRQPRQRALHIDIRCENPQHERANVEIVAKKSLYFMWSEVTYFKNIWSSVARLRNRNGISSDSDCEPRIASMFDRRERARARARSYLNCVIRLGLVWQWIIHGWEWKICRILCMTNANWFLIWTNARRKVFWKFASNWNGYWLFVFCVC